MCTCFPQKTTWLVVACAVFAAAISLTFFDHCREDNRDGTTLNKAARCLFMSVGYTLNQGCCTKQKNRSLPGGYHIGHRGSI